MDNNRYDFSSKGYEGERRPASRLVALALAFFLLGSIAAGVAVTYMASRQINGVYAEAQARIDETEKKLEEMSRLIESVTASGSGLNLVETSGTVPAASKDPVVAIAETCSSSVVGVTTYVQRSGNSGSYFFPFGGFSTPAPDSSQDKNSEPVYDVSGYGSGVIISEDGYIITNHHVISGVDKVVVTLHDGIEYSAEIIGSDEYNDVALLKIIDEVSGLKPAVIGDSDKTQVGEMSVAIGNPLGYELFGTVTMGIISANDREVTLSDGSRVKFIQTDAAINSGNSGGGLFNSKGELIGITSMKISSTYYGSASIEGLSFAIPINRVMSIANELKESGSVNYPTLGISASNVSQPDETQYGTKTGVMIMNLTDDYPAKKAGIQVGDIITHYNGAKIDSFNDLKNMLYTSRVGDTVTITVMREKQSVDVEVTFNYDSVI